HIEEMTRQFEMLGESMDPTLYYQTDAEYYRRVTQLSFIKLFNKGLIYKGEFPVNWCPRCGTSIAEAEVEYQTRQTKLNYIQFTEVESGKHVTIATTRPELLCACQMVAIHPDDEDKAWLRGKKLLTPIFNKPVPIQEDEGVDPEFGTGVVMVCTIGDKDDMEWVHKYKLQIEMGIDGKGDMTELAGSYEGLTISDARQKIIEDLKEAGLLIKQEPLEQNVGACWRCSTPIEFIQVPQWFLKTVEFKDDILKRADEIGWFPEYMKIRLRNWTESLAWDWPISRKRYFATPLPLWECRECPHVELASEENCYVDPTLDAPPVASCPKCGGEMGGCTDVFDTWMDSSISPLYISFWQRDDERFARLYPTSLRPQAQDIIRTWAFYTILRSHLLVDSKPWDQIMIGAYILSPDGTPMHASKGNVVDPLEILEEYGADPMRYYAANCGLGEDSPLRYKDLTRGKKLVIKFWNVARFISGMTDLGNKPSETTPPLRSVDKWILTRYSQLVDETTTALENYQFDKAVRGIEQFIWHELADHYVEMVKYRSGGGDQALHYTLYTIGLGTAKLLAPILPHVTEDIYQQYFAKSEGCKSIHTSSWPKEPGRWMECLEEGEVIKDVIATIRNWKSEKGMALNAPIDWAGIVFPQELEKTDINDIKGTARLDMVERVERNQVTEVVSGIRPIHSKIGPEFKAQAREINAYLAKADPAHVASELLNGKMAVPTTSGKIFIGPEHVEIMHSLSYHGEAVESIPAGKATVLLRAVTQEQR
ncbi:MAG: valine--tRNA ligase, partial [Candidatus Thermoplasmatota archaeon]|nr:valine--tRNA ligase [Candidatus Thermoplasmatota archaeon]